MSDANLLKTLLIILCCFAANAEEPAPKRDIGFEPIEEVGQFRAHMLDHPFVGCPTNSLCNKEMGQRRSKWLKALKGPKAHIMIEKFRKKNGFPINIWTRDKVIKHNDLIVWDSFCPKHKPKPTADGVINTEQKIYIAQAWYKDFNQIKKSLKEEKEIILNQAYLLDSKGKVTTYTIPRAEAPLFIKDKNLYFTMEEEGSYYGMWISSNGRMKLGKTFLPKNFPNEVKCPEALSKSFKDGIKNQNLYQGFFCKTIWNQSVKKYNTIALGWSCN